ncbi:hypothetical protein PVA19_10245 [Agrobacterium sp. CNPSo 3708]|uniref:restriction endonuclease n=1 Tax=Agrobacterium sp. CNPSo 3708 TaxID=3028150 RepID=UPI0023643366|nr:hypothetical protein [Agrobacterium sp. CNPSo 3708]MDD1498791.1 hypothetical protein [Agrobacterium sp. CNPSo 3708]
MSIDPTWIANELTEIGALGCRAQEKGQRLERLIQTIFSEIPGLEFDTADHRNFYQTEEIDLLFWNDRERDGVHFLDCPLIIECKSSATPVSGRDVRYFANTLSDKGRSSGILVALAGVAGDDERVTAGIFHITAALLTRVSVLVVTREDLLSWRSASDIVHTLKRGLLSLVRDQVLAVDAAVRRR